MSWDVWKHGHPPIELYGTEGSLRVPDPNFFGGAVEYTERGGDWVSLDSSEKPFGRPNWRSPAWPRQRAGSRQLPLPRRRRARERGGPRHAAPRLRRAREPRARRHARDAARPLNRAAPSRYNQAWSGRRHSPMTMPPLAHRSRKPVPLRDQREGDGMPATMKGPAIFLAQFAGDAAPFNSLDVDLRLGGEPRLQGRADSELGRAGCSTSTRPRRRRPIATRSRASRRSTASRSPSSRPICRASWSRCIRPMTRRSTRFAPAPVQGNPKARQAWAVDQLMQGGARRRAVSG